MISQLISVGSTAFYHVRDNMPRNLEQEYSVLFQVNITSILLKWVFYCLIK